MFDGDTLGIAATQHESVTRRLALGLAHGVGATLLTTLTLLVLAALHLYHAQTVLANLQDKTQRTRNYQMKKFK